MLVSQCRRLKRDPTRIYILTLDGLYVHLALVLYVPGREESRFRLSKGLALLWLCPEAPINKQCSAIVLKL